MQKTHTEKAQPGRYMILAALMFGGIMGPIDASIVNVILPTITQSFAVDISTAQWVPMIYLLTISSLLLFYGRLGDILGYKKVYFYGLSAFVFSSALCGLSPSIHWLIIFRAVQGLAAGMMMSVPFAILTASFLPEERGKALGINAISISAGLAIGPTLGGFITSVLSWRYVFFINIPIGLAALLWARHIIPDIRGHAGKMDLPGAITAFVTLLSILLFVNFYQKWGIGLLSYFILLTAAVSGVLFLLLERKSGQPMVNLGLFRNLTFSFANISALLSYMSQYVMVFLTPFYLQRILNYTPDKVGLVMTAFPLVVIFVAPLSGTLSDHIGTRTLACLGAGISAIALFFMSQLSAAAEAFDVAWRLGLFGLGTGIFQSPNNNAVMGSVPRPHLGVASGILATMRNVGMVFGIAIAGAVLYIFVPPHIFHGSIQLHLDNTAFLSGLQHAYIVGGMLSVFAVITSLFRNR